MTPDAPFAPDVGELLDLRFDLLPEDAEVVTVRIRGIDLRYEAAKRRLSFLDASAEIDICEGRIPLHILVDRTSLELFAHDGEISMSCCFLPEAAEHVLSFHAHGGSARLDDLRVHELDSAWSLANETSRHYCLKNQRGSCKRYWRLIQEGCECG